MLLTLAKVSSVGFGDPKHGRTCRIGHRESVEGLRVTNATAGRSYVQNNDLIIAGG